MSYNLINEYLNQFVRVEGLNRKKIWDICRSPCSKDVMKELWKRPDKSYSHMKKVSLSSKEKFAFFFQFSFQFARFKRFFPEKKVPEIFKFSFRFFIINLYRMTIFFYTYSKMLKPEFVCLGRPTFWGFPEAVWPPWWLHSPTPACTTPQLDRKYR